MKAEDTVMTKEQINEIIKEVGSNIPEWVKWDIRHPTHKECLAQAEITLRAARKEIVEWAFKPCTEHFATGYIGGNNRLHYECNLCWQGMLKEWGIDSA